MPNFYLIIISVSIVFGITIIMSIIDWIYLHSLSLKITFLELEVEKKTREYDRLRKNLKKIPQNELKKNASGFTSEISANHIQTSCNQGIEVVRNVRKPFNPQSDIQQTYIQSSITPQQSALPEQNSDTYKTDISALNNSPASRKEPEPPQDIITLAPPVSNAPDDITNDALTLESSANNNVILDDKNYVPISEDYNDIPILQNDNNAIKLESYSDLLNSENDNNNPEIDTQPRTECDAADVMDDVMDVINEVPSSEQQPDSITLPLFSASNNDADFENLWHNLSDLLHSKQDAHIFIDFSNIQFLYDKELDYLEKICHAAQIQGSSIKFANCDKELTGLLCKRPLLLSHLT